MSEKKTVEIQNDLSVNYHFLYVMVIRWIGDDCFLLLVFDVMSNLSMNIDWGKCQLTVKAWWVFTEFHCMYGLRTVQCANEKQVFYSEFFGITFWEISIGAMEARVSFVVLHAYFNLATNSVCTIFHLFRSASMRRQSCWMSTTTVRWKF